MIDFFAYYSAAGYKDMYLGNTASKEDKVYYSPLWDVWKKQSADGDEQARKLLEEVNTLPHIEIINNDSKHSLPPMAQKLVVHGGYRIACCNLGNGKYSVAIKDITNQSKDEYHRDNPFMLQLIGDNIAQMDNIADYIRTHREDCYNHFAELFEYNPILNCIQFNIGKLNTFISQISYNDMANYANSHKTIRQVVLPDGITIKYFVEIYKISVNDIDSAYAMSGERIPIDNFDSTFSNTNTFTSNESSFIDQIINTIRDFLQFDLHLNWDSRDKEDFDEIRKILKRIINRHR